MAYMHWRRLIVEHLHKLCCREPSPSLSISIQVVNNSSSSPPFRSTLVDAVRALNDTWTGQPIYCYLLGNIPAFHSTFFIVSRLAQCHLKSRLLRKYYPAIILAIFALRQVCPQWSLGLRILIERIRFDDVIWAGLCEMRPHSDLIPQNFLLLSLLLPSAPVRNDNQQWIWAPWIFLIQFVVGSHHHCHHHQNIQHQTQCIHPLRSLFPSFSVSCSSYGAGWILCWPLLWLW